MLAGMKKIALMSALALSGCGIYDRVFDRTPEDPLLQPPVASADGQLRPQSRPVEGAVAAPTQGAQTAEQFDTTTDAQRTAASQAPASSEVDLGLTIASLGSPSEPGFWLKTPLVDRQGPGRVLYPETGKTVQVTLIPIDGPKTAGSRLSLPALRLIEAPLTGLPQVRVFSGSGSNG
jgi:hypothetical protein